MPFVTSCECDRNHILTAIALILLLHTWKNLLDWTVISLQTGMSAAVDVRRGWVLYAGPVMSE